MRLPIAAAFDFVDLLEHLSQTPSEVHRQVFENPDIDVIDLSPPPILIPVPPFTWDEDQKYKPASPAEMRQKKIQGLRMVEEQQRRKVVDESE